MDGRFRYLPSIFRHEFGHAIGLTDLYKEPNNGADYSGYLTNKTVSFTVPAKDSEYVRQVYLSRHGARPH